MKLSTTVLEVINDFIKRSSFLLKIIKKYIN